MKPHVVLIPFPAQGHITPMLRLAKLLHSRGFFVTFVNTESSHDLLVRVSVPESLTGLQDFQFKTIPDAQLTLDKDATRDCQFIKFIKSLNESPDCPDVSCIVSDGILSIAFDAAEQLDIPVVVFFVFSACGILCYFHFEELVNRGLFPLKDKSQLTNGYLETEIDWVPGMKHIRLRDFPDFIRTTDPNDFMVNHIIQNTKQTSRAKAVIINTYYELESEAIDALRQKLSHVTTIGPLQLLEIKSPEVRSIGSSLWKQDDSCIAWLDQRAPNSVLYVSFASTTILSPEQLLEFARGLADSGQYFLWIIRPELVGGESAVLPEEYLKEVEGRAMLMGWCPQEDVLAHPAVGGFLTHCGWNSMIESISQGLPVICWPFFTEHTTICRYACRHWEIGLEIEGEVKGEKVAELVKVLMVGEKGKEMKKKALEWKEKAEAATKPGGSSYRNFELLVNQVLLKS